MKAAFFSALFAVLAISANCQSAHCQSAQCQDNSGIRWVSTSDSLFVLVDSTDKVLTMVKYQKVFPFDEGIAYVVRDNSIGFVNLSGAEVGRCIFDWASERFAYSQFVYRKGSERITLMHNPSFGYVWVSEKGKMLVFSPKEMYSVTDKIPDALWDY